MLIPHPIIIFASLKMVLDNIFGLNKEVKFEIVVNPIHRPNLKEKMVIPINMDYG